MIQRKHVELDELITHIKRDIIDKIDLVAPRK